MYGSLGVLDHRLHARRVGRAWGLRVWDGPRGGSNVACGTLVVRPHHQLHPIQVFGT